MGVPFETLSGYCQGMRRVPRLFSALALTLVAAACSGGGGGNATGGTGTATDTDAGSTSTTDPTTTGATGTTADPTTTGATDSGGTTTGVATTATTGPACPDAPVDGDYGECNDEMWMCMGGGFCLQSATPGEFGVCSRGCTEDCQCWAKPATGTANPKCDPDLGAGNNGVCVLDCANARTCPDGMYCEPGYSVCVFTDTSGATSTSTSTSTSTTG
jgi:hypothetical protein